MHVSGPEAWVTSMLFRVKLSGKGYQRLIENEYIYIVIERRFDHRLMATIKQLKNKRKVDVEIEDGRKANKIKLEKANLNEMS
jgi:hypothetical protein